MYYNNCQLFNHLCQCADIIPYFVRYDTPSEKILDNNKVHMIEYIA